MLTAQVAKRSREEEGGKEGKGGKGGRGALC